MSQSILPYHLRAFYRYKIYNIMEDSWLCPSLNYKKLYHSLNCQILQNIVRHDKMEAIHVNDNILHTWQKWDFSLPSANFFVIVLHTAYFRLAKWRVFNGLCQQTSKFVCSAPQYVYLLAPTGVFIVMMCYYRSGTSARSSWSSPLVVKGHATFFTQSTHNNCSKSSYDGALPGP